MHSKRIAIGLACGCGFLYFLSPAGAQDSNSGGSAMGQLNQTTQGTQTFDGGPGSGINTSAPSSTSVPEATGRPTSGESAGSSTNETTGASSGNSSSSSPHHSHFGEGGGSASAPTLSPNQLMALEFKRRGIFALSLGDNHAAEDAFREALARTPGDAELLGLLRSAEDRMSAILTSEESRENSWRVLDAPSDRTNVLDAPRISNTASFDPRTLVTDSEYRDAKVEEAPLLRRRQILQSQLDKLLSWNAGLQNDSEEFEKIRQEAQVDYINDVLMAVPFGDVFSLLKDAKYLTPGQTLAITAGFDALKAAVSSAETFNAKDSEVQLEKIMDAHSGIRDALMDHAKEGLTCPEKGLCAIDVLERSAAIMEGAKQLIIFSQQKDHSLPAYGQLLVKLAIPTMALAKTIPAKEVGEHVATSYGSLAVSGAIIAAKVGNNFGTDFVTQRAVDSLDLALSKNFNAIYYLRSRLETTDGLLASAQETIHKYETVHP